MTFQRDCREGHNAVEPCAAIGQDDFSTIPGASTTILSATPVAASSNTLGNYAGCEVSGLIAPQIQFQLMLPTQHYQGKYLQLGCGGYCGTDTLSTPAASYGCVPVTTGQFAEATDNEGHAGAVFSGAFAADLNLRVDFGYASEHALAVAAKAIIAVFYGHRPAESYFDGCSQGGHEGLLEAQRYPADFNGIIAGAPASILTPLNIFYQGWNALANTGPGGQPILTAADLAPLHAAVVKACDTLDGTKDGLIADPFACHWNPKSIQCAPGQTSTTANFCLTAAQVTTVNKLYDGPVTSSGQLLYPGWELRGSEDNWTSWIVPTSGPESGSVDWGIATQTIKYLMNSGAEPDLTINDIQFTTAYFAKLMKETAGIYDATDPDLTAFRNDGGKLILWQGLADPAISPVGTIAYYQAVQNYMGGAAATNAFARLFMLPGVSSLRRRRRARFLQRPGCTGELGREGPGTQQHSDQQSDQRQGHRDPAGVPVPAYRRRHHRRSRYRGVELHAESRLRCTSTPTSGGQAASARATSGSAAGPMASGPADPARLVLREYPRCQGSKPCRPAEEEITECTPLRRNRIAGRCY